MIRAEKHAEINTQTHTQNRTHSRDFSLLRFPGKTPSTFVALGP